MLVPPAARPFWDAIVQARPRDTWNPVDLASAANLARVQCALEAALIGSDEHMKLTRLALALTRAIAVNTVATVGRSADIAKGAELGAPGPPGRWGRPYPKAARGMSCER